jgi:uncharacterized protein (TIGR03084 family)
MTRPDDRLRSVLADLETEGGWLDDHVADLSDDGWRTVTPAEGWDVATTIAHLAWTDEVAVAAATDPDAWHALVEKAAADPNGFVDQEAQAGGKEPPAELLARWRAARARIVEVLLARDPADKIPWFGPPMSPTSMATARYMETWAHALDVADALGAAVEPHDRMRHVVHLGVRTRGYSFMVRELDVPTDEVRVELTSPGGDLWAYGPEDAPERLTGPAWDFALLVTQRANRADLDLRAEGVGAEAWLDVAQAFAGPPGDGRPPSKVV